MNNKIYEILEFDRIRESINKYTSTSRGKEIINQLEAETDKQKVERLLKQTEELVTVNRQTVGLPIQRIDDLFDIFKRLELKAVLSSTELSRLKPNLVSVTKILDFISTLRDTDFYNELTELTNFTNRLIDFPDLQTEISKAVDDNGTVLDSASSDLTKIRRQITFTRDEIRNTLNEMTRNSMSKFLSEPTVSIRDDVYVLPVKAEYRSKFGGVVHDQSQTGQTLYIEPAKVTGLNDNLHELGLQEKFEINRVLQMISNQLFDHVDELKNNNELIAIIDSVNAKSKFALELNAVKPIVNSQKEVNLISARHPLIDKDRAVTNSVEIGKEYTSLIVTGPNTGGKTVLMKTVGLLELMAQSGLYITAEKGTSIYSFDEILADIGDEQSLEQSLSTFSSHMVNIKHILNMMSNDSLVLLDELGAGTDPGEGAALAMAITDRIAKSGALSIVTTHYPELKVFADQNDFAMNSSMEFDSETLRPTYRLLVGIPGQSNALAISKRIGLDDQLLDDARKYVDPESQKLNDLIVNIVDKQQQVARAQNELDLLTKQVAADKQQLETESEKLDQQKAKIVFDAKNEANHIIAQAKKDAEKVLSEIRKERLKAGSQTGKNEQELKATINQLDNDRQDVTLEKNKVLQKAKSKKEFHVGEDVLVTEYNQTGVLTRKLTDRQWEVKLGILKMKVDEDDIQKIQVAKTTRPKVQQKSVKVTKTSSNSIRGSLDLRGWRYEDALNELDRYLDKAVLNNLGTVEIIHGKGSGALRSGVTQALRSDRRVSHFEFANPNGAGDGATIVELA
ncbi:MAG: endonuclease MutS2 [Lactobacillaceae bacterium]|nr:endonuclease MutS2 [Lactobacillaceae bacterium]